MHKRSPPIILGLCLCLSGVSLSLAARDNAKPPIEPATPTELPTLDLPAKDEPRQQQPPASDPAQEPWPILDLGLCDS